MAIITRWLMPPESWCGKAPSRVSGAGMPTWCSSSSGAAARAACGAALVHRERLGDLEPDREAGVRGGHRLLEDHRHVLADQPAALARAGCSRSWPSKASRSAVTRPGQGSRPITASMATLLPEPVSPTMPTTSPASTVRSTPSTAWSGPRAVPELDREVADLEQRHGAQLLQLGVERVAQAVAEQVEGQHGDQDGEAREGHHPPGAQHELARVGQHRAPFRRRRLGAEAEEAQCRGVEDRGGEAERRLHDQRRQAVRQHGLEHQPQRAGAGDARCR